MERSEIVVFACRFIWDMCDWNLQHKSLIRINSYTHLWP